MLCSKMEIKKFWTKMLFLPNLLELLNVTIENKVSVSCKAPKSMFFNLYFYSFFIQPTKFFFFFDLFNNL